MPLGELLFEAAERHSGETVVFAGGRTWAYAELAADGARLSRALAACGIGGGDRVGVAAVTGYGALVALLGTLDAGGVYVPLGPVLDGSRPRLVAEDADLSAVVDLVAGADRGQISIRYGRSGQALLDPSGPEPMPWSEIARHEAAPLGAGAAPASELAYVFYTSGSTGVPKGAAHSHRSASALLEWVATDGIVSKGDRVAAVASIDFDISLLELVAPVLLGAEIVALERGSVLFPGAFAAAIEAARPTVLQLVPQLWRGLLDPARSLASLRVALVTGEAMAPTHWSALRAATKGARLLNLYGSTEINSCVRFELPGDWEADDGEPPIGFPAAGAEAVVLGGSGAAAPPGELGELAVASPMQMRGYLNRPGDSAERIVALPGGRKAFRTGDVAFVGEDGALRLAGRLDRVVKVRGERVDLGSVETVAAEHEDVEEALAVLVDDGSQAFVHLIVAAGDIDQAEVRRHCMGRLERAAWPRSVELVAQLPRGIRGKVETQATPTAAGDPTR